MSEPADADAAATAAAAQVDGPGHSNNRFFKLQDFWTAAPHAWFGYADSQFRLRGVTAEDDKFGLVVAVLPESSARKISQLLANPPAACYTALKTSLLSNHQLTDIQKAELLFNLDDLGSRRPMDLLAEMLELVEPGEEKTKLFAMLFLRRLPAQVRGHLSEDDHTNLQALAEKADRVTAFVARQAGQAQLNVAAVSSEDPDAAEEFSVAAVGGRGGRGGRNFKGRQRGGKQFVKRGPQQQQSVQQQQQSSQPPVDEAPGDVARSTTGLCFYHFTYGSRARSCRAPCVWSGN